MTKPRPSTPIRVLLVDDSPVALSVLARTLSPAPDIEVVGTARDGEEALEQIDRLQPTVLCTDLDMPRMNGLELIRSVMSHSPLPILVISGLIKEEDAAATFELLQAGAVDVFPKPRLDGGAADGRLAQELIDKIRVLSGVVVFKRRRAAALSPPMETDGSARRKGSVVEVVGIGASTGGPQALSLILSQLPASLPVPVVCVQHISQGFLPGLVSWLAATCGKEIQIVRSEQKLQPGFIYFPEEGTHLVANRRGTAAPSKAPPCDGHRPSVTVAFQSLAHRYGKAAMGVLLTGMGCDGAEGMAAISRAGGVTIAQDEASSVVFGMPKQAIELNAARYVLPVDRIAAAIAEHA